MKIPPLPQDCPYGAIAICICLIGLILCHTFTQFGWLGLSLSRTQAAEGDEGDVRPGDIENHAGQGKVIHDHLQRLICASD